MLVGGARAWKPVIFIQVLHKRTWRSHDNAKKGLAAALAVGLLSRDRAVAAVLDDC